MKFKLYFMVLLIRFLFFYCIIWVKSIVRDSDIVARYSGEEFVVLLHESTPEGAKKVAEKIRTTFSNKSILLMENMLKKISIGVAFFPSEAETIREAIKHADVALCKAKERGRNRVVVFEQSMFKEKKLLVCNLV